jgi:hypothetical protein
MSFSGFDDFFEIWAGASIPEYWQQQRCKKLGENFYDDEEL